MIVRKLEAADVEQVTKIEQACFSTPWSKQGFEDILFREDVLFLVACERDEVLGYVGVYCSFDEGEITNVAVALDKRRQKVAEHLLDELIIRLGERQIERIVLEVRVSNRPAIELYKKFGFVNVGTRKNFYQKPTEDAWIMIRG